MKELLKEELVEINGGGIKPFKTGPIVIPVLIKAFLRLI
jgi:hypothetical protein